MALERNLLATAHGQIVGHGMVRSQDQVQKSILCRYMDCKLSGCVTETGTSLAVRFDDSSLLYIMSDISDFAKILGLAS